MSRYSKRILLIAQFFLCSTTFAQTESSQIPPTRCMPQAAVAEASAAYQVPQTLINKTLSAMESKGYGAGVVRDERVGPMAIPTEWLSVFEYMGISAQAIKNDPCQAIFAGAWILAYQAELGTRHTGQMVRAIGIPPTIRARRKEWADVVKQAANATGMPAALIEAVITVESAYKQSAISPKGAIGLMQLMPETARGLGVNPHIGAENIMGGARYLAKLYAQFSGDLRLVLAAYNAGPAAVTRNGYRVPSFAETKAYVPRVLGIYATLAAK